MTTEPEFRVRDKVVAAGLDYYARVRCPVCSEYDLVPFHLAGRLIVDDEGRKMRVTVKQTAMDHECRQTMIDVHLPEDDVQPRLFDAREAAAGGPGLD
jgi:hypothetical protein